MSLNKHGNFIIINNPLAMLVENIIDKDIHEDCFILSLESQCIRLITRENSTIIAAYRSTNRIYIINQAVKFALKKQAQFICLLDANIKLTMDAWSHLKETYIKEKNIGACSLPVSFAGKTIYRANWNLCDFEILHDTNKINDWPFILESDFCEYGCILFPASIFSKVGLFDIKYGLYTAVLEFCYRLWQDGYRTVYNLSSSINRAANHNPFYTQKDKSRFFKKYMKYGVNFDGRNKNVGYSWQGVDRGNEHYLIRYGLQDGNRPRYKLYHPFVKNISYLRTVWETTKLPSGWKANLSLYEHIFVPSNWNRKIFENEGAKNVSTVPHGILTDIFHPFGRKIKIHNGKIFLVVCEYQYRKALDVTIRAWNETKDDMPNAFLYILCHKMPNLPGEPDHSEIRDKIQFNYYLKNQIVNLVPVEFLDTADMAALYRGADVFVNNSRSEGFGFPIVEAMACGTITIIPDYSAPAEFIKNDHCIALRGSEVVADYSDMGFKEVGNWFEPSFTHLKECLLKAYNLSEKDIERMSYDARQFVLNHFTWRASMRAMKNALESFQKPQRRDLNDELSASNTILGRKIKKFRDIAKSDGYYQAIKESVGFLFRVLGLR